MLLGKVVEVWRYPVKSMGGERVRSAFVKKRGVAGDRCWAVIDRRNEEILNAKRWPELLHYRASLCADEDLPVSGYDDEVPDVHIHCPSGHLLRGRDADTEQQLGAQLGFHAGLSPLVHPGNKDHYKTREPRDSEAMAREWGLVPDAEDPVTRAQMEKLRMEVGTFITPPGTYVDAFPVHLLTTNSLRYLREKGGVDVALERFRPNLLIEPLASLAELTENDWVHRRLRLGDVVLRIDSKTGRCSMPARAQAWCGVTAQSTMSRTMAEVCDRHLGVNAMVEKAGKIAVNDEVVLLDA